MLSMKLKFILIALLAGSLVSGSLASAELLRWVEGSWTLVVLPDTGAYVVDHLEIFNSQTQWIADHKDDRDITFVLHVGSVTNDNAQDQWENAESLMRILDMAGVPYAIAPGDNDYDFSRDRSARESLMKDYFSPWRYDSLPTFGDTHDAGMIENSYHFFSAGGNNYTVLSLEYHPSDEILAWADEVLAHYKDHIAIILTNSYLCADPSNKTYPVQPGTPYEHSIASIYVGWKIWENLVASHDNVAFVFCGQCNRVASHLGDTGNIVHEIAVSFENRAWGKDGYMRLIEFLPDGVTVQVKTYSPYLDQYLTDEKNQFILLLAVQPHPLGEEEREVTLLQPTHPPIADAGPDQIVHEGTEVTLDGSNSTDPDDDIVSYFWEQTAGISVSLSDPTAVQPTFKAPFVGSRREALVFQLTVTDSIGLQDTDSVVIEVINFGENGDDEISVFLNCFVVTAAYTSPMARKAKKGRLNKLVGF
jgi:hypothetical protein